MLAASADKAVVKAKKVVRDPDVGLYPWPPTVPYPVSLGEVAVASPRIDGDGDGGIAGVGGEILLVVVLVPDVETVCEVEECEEDRFVIWKGECSRRWSACRCSDCDFCRDAEY